jgi:hypothetical protein
MAWLIVSSGLSRIEGHEPTSPRLRSGESRARSQSARTEPSISSGGSVEAATSATRFWKTLYTFGKVTPRCLRYFPALSAYDRSHGSSL